MISLAELMCNFLESKSIYTAVHSHGVTATAEALGRLSGLSPEEVSMMSIAGYLHDVGKFAIPLEILEKQGELNREEFLLMKSHAFYTYEVLSEIKGFETIRDWSALHHERLDGSGYPFGLKGEELSRGARIMAIADIFSALREKRPYRQVMDKKSITKILSQQASEGKLDEEIVSLLLSHYEEIDSLFLEAEFSAFSRFPELQNTLIAILAPGRIAPA